VSIVLQTAAVPKVGEEIAQCFIFLGFDDRLRLCRLRFWNWHAY
jgi:hypothetical protein